MNSEKIRSDFPILHNNLSGNQLIYMDNACQTLRPMQVISKINEYYEQYPACAGRSIHRMGRRVTDEIENSRKIIKKFIGAKKSEEIIFTKNTTEGLNIVFNSIKLKRGDIIATTDKEHNSTLIPIQLLCENKGTVHRVLESKDDNTFDIDKFSEMMTNDVKIVSVVHTSNIDGVTNPIKEITKIAHDNNSLVMIDGAQSVPQREINISKIGADFLAFSGHKMCGPSGTGVLYGRLDLLKEMTPVYTGGETVSNTTYKTREMEEPPQKFEPGLQNYAGIVGLGEAANYIKKIGLDKIKKHEIELNKLLTESVSNLPIDILGPGPELRSGIFSFNMKGFDPHELAIMMDQTANICIRSGMHCAHSWFNSHNIKGSARASFYFYNTKEEIEKFTSVLGEIVKLK